MKRAVTSRHLKDRTMNETVALSAGEAQILNPDQAYTSEQAAYWLGTTREYLAKARCQGRGPKYFKLGRSIRYRGSDLRTFMEQGDA